MPASAKHLLELIERSGKHPGVYEYRIPQFKHEWDHLKKSGSTHEFKLFVPIRIVTIIEVTFRALLKNIVDGNELCKQNAVQLITKIPSKEILQIMLNLEKDNFTIGDIVSHTVPCSKVEDIINTMEIVYGNNFKTDLADSRERWTEDKGVYDAPFIHDMDKTLSVISRIFSVRHIAVHEIPLKEPFKKDELEQFFEHGEKFASALSWLEPWKLYGHIPRTQSQMNVSAFERVQEIEKQLWQSRNDPALVLECTDDYSHYAVWSWFAHLVADARSGRSLGRAQSGSIAPTIYYGVLTELNKWRLKDLQACPDLVFPGGQWNPKRNF